MKEALVKFWKRDRPVGKYERVVVPKVVYNSEKWKSSVQERGILEVFEVMCLRNVCEI